MKEPELVNPDRQTEDRLMVGRGWEKGGGEEDWLLHGHGILFWGDDKLLELIEPTL